MSPDPWLLGFHDARRVGAAPGHLALLASQGSDRWPGKFAPVPPVFVEIVRHLAPREEVHINVAGTG